MESEGDPRVHFVMNVVLSTLFAYIFLWGLDLIGAVGFTLQRLGLIALIVMALTQILVLSD